MAYIMGNIRKLLLRAEDLFQNGAYNDALTMYGLALKEQPASREARIGAMLSDVALENDEEAQAIFDYYQVLKNESNPDAETIIEEMIGSLDDAAVKIAEFFDGVDFFKEELADGIDYDEFKSLILQRGSFKRAFEDIMFSTRVIITEKDDLLDFVERLSTNGFKEMAIRYLEGAAVAFPTEPRLRDLLEKIKS